jgi:hypothetical protein
LADAIESAAAGEQPLIQPLTQMRKFGSVSGRLAIGLAGCILIACAQNSALQPPTSPTPEPAPSAPATQPAQAAPPAAIFQAAVAELSPKTNVPILLPKTVTDADRLFARVTAAEPARYEISLDYTPDCQGSTACRWGSFAGAVSAPTVQVVQGKAVALQNGIMADFVDAKCGASCSDSTLTWEQAGHRYRIALKAGKEQTLVDLANSAIANGAF